jgi:CRISPR/Cas system CSM-associated protein Csm3 (group 7 of RAMP superfamily)
MTLIELTYRIRLLTPLHIGTGTGFARMVDDTVVRAGAAKGEGVHLPCIPGSSVKGKTRSRCEAIGNMLGLDLCDKRKCKRNPCVICRLFGSTYVSGNLYFSDALLIREWQAVGRPLTNDTGSEPFALATVRTGNKSERATRTVEPDFLFSHEYAAKDLEYKGTIHGQICTREIEGMGQPLPVEGWLLVVGLQAVDKIGGLRSRGLGRCRIEIKELFINDQKEDVSSLFRVGDFDVEKLRNALQDDRKANTIILEKLGMSAEDLRQTTEEDFMRAFNGVLQMPDLFDRLDEEIQISRFSDEIQQVLEKKGEGASTVDDRELLLLNRAILQATYPHEIEMPKKNFAENLNELLTLEDYILGLDDYDAQT